MAKEARKQVGLTMRATLYDDLTKLAKERPDDNVCFGTSRRTLHSVCCSNSEGRTSGDNGACAPVGE
jgi:hypothetical protein